MKVWLIVLVLSFSSISFDNEANVKSSVIFADLNVCKFKMNNLYGGDYEVDKKEVPALLFYSKVIKPNSRRPIEVDLKFRCVDPADAQTFVNFSGGKMTDKGWVMSLDPDVEADTSMHNTFYVLKGKSWEGPAISQDVTNGEEEDRTRGFGFCIPHGSAALCGGGNVAYLNDLNGSALKEVIKMVETIEFVE